MILVALSSGLMLFWSIFGNRIRGVKEVDCIGALQLINHKNALVLDVREEFEADPAGQTRRPRGRAGALPRATHRGGMPQRPAFGFCLCGAGQAGLLPGIQPEWRRRGLAKIKFTVGEIIMAKVVMYCTEVCPYCVRAENLLKKRGVTEIEKIRIDLNPEQRDIMVAKTGRRTVPQIYIGERHVGGFDDMAELDSQGELVPLLNN
jgi:glutaredoxin 3